ncbi:MAG: hypothetical protein JWM80_588 [Cyanobacteria bacterium RYN_339]|nr:hypothetical protein [Cyanobacteria bacterium RYN_339]
MKTLAWILAAPLLASCQLWPAASVAAPVQAAATTRQVAPPWPAPADPLPGLRAAHIEDYLQLAGGSHIHAHLSVFYDGVPVTVPASLGMDPHGIFIAPLHTHTPTGVLHLQAPPGKTYTLGQIFAVWGVSLQGAAVFDHGEAVAEPQSYVVQDHHEVVVAYGTLPPRIPVEYNGWLCIDWSLCE